MTDAEKNRVIAETISPERGGWAWEGCKWTWCNNMETGQVEADEDCPHCHGTGRIPVELHKPPYTWLLWCWFNRWCMKQNCAIPFSAPKSAWSPAQPALDSCEWEFHRAGRGRGEDNSSREIRDIACGALTAATKPG